ncbi:MAG: protein-L-isoaspartate O-methyltransferase [Hyphomicrobiales bacterium]|nr:protein-L-isoaspartate O-methyltransferase [Hyphomicrobiales bacterium]
MTDQLHADAAEDALAGACEPLPAIDDPAFGRLIDRYAGARVVALGEATHGTSEFYRARMAITQRLVDAHGYTIVAVEADWPDAASVDAYVRGAREAAPREAAEAAFTRFPTWMWRNEEMHDFAEWLRERNERTNGEKVSFHGLDLYSLNTSMSMVLDYVSRVDPQEAQAMRARYGCLARWKRNPSAYGGASLNAGYALCEHEVQEALAALFRNRLDYMARDGDAFLDAAQNARLVAAAERYYRVMYEDSAQSWNLRDDHMFDTLQHVLEARGPHAKAIVWAHNSHVGDARETEMGARHGERNLGQLCRQRYAEEAALIGFGTDHGWVAAADDWGGRMHVKQVQPARQDSVEGLFHRAAPETCFIDLRAPGEARALLERVRLERAIGVIYRPESERTSHYFDASLARQFDGYVWFDETRAVTPLGDEPRPGAFETYPFGV